MEINNKIITLYLLILLFTSCDNNYLTNYEKKWREHDTLYFQKKVIEILDDDKDEIMIKNFLLSDVTNIFFVDRDFFKRVKYCDEYQIFIKKNSYYFWNEFFTNNNITDNKKIINMSNFFIYDRVYSNDEKKQIHELMYKVKIANNIDSHKKKNE